MPFFTLRKEQHFFAFELATLMFDICHLLLLRLLKMDRYTKEQRIVIVKTHYKFFENESSQAVTENGIRYRVPLYLTFCRIYWTTWASKKCDFNRMVPHAIQQDKPSIC